MADNVAITAGSGTSIGTVDVGSGRQVQIVTDGSQGATLANVAASATNVTLRAASDARAGLTIYNDSDSILYVKCGATASSTSFTVRMTPNSYYEMPFGYNGIVDGIWVTATGNARVTEFTY